MNLWNNKIEVQFFTEALKSFASPEQLFYNINETYYAYIPKNFKTVGQTLQSRNSLIGKFTEKWCRNIFEPIAKKLNLYAVNNVICEEIGLSKNSSGDLAICVTDKVVQPPENIKLLFEIKMSIISNYIYKPKGLIKFIGDFNHHKGSPSLLRSDSMLKAIGKSINIRVSGTASKKIPIIIIGNSPITKNYVKKVDFLKTAGIIQGFWSLNPKPTNHNFIKKSPKLGFQTFKNTKELFDELQNLINKDLNYFSSMISKEKLGEIIKLANQEKSNIQKAEKFLLLINK